MEIVSELKALGIEVRSETTTFKVWCPVCYNRKQHKRDKDLSVNPVEGVYKCHSPNCSFKGRVQLKKYNRPDATTIDEQRINLAYTSFMKERCISRETFIKLRAHIEGGELRFNYFKNEQYVNFKSRNLKEKSFHQYAGGEKVVYNHDSLKGKKKCIITEGEMDVATWVELGFDSEYAIVSIDQGAGEPDSILDGKLECIKNSSLNLDRIEEFFLAGDNDAPGQYTFMEIADRLGRHRCKKIGFGTFKDSNAVLMSLVKNGSDAKPYFEQLIVSATPYPIGGVQDLDDDMMELMMDEYDNGEIKGIKLVGNPISQLWSSLAGEQTLFIGYPGDGKSTMARNIMVQYALQHNYKWACFCPEDNPAKYFYKDLAKIYLGKQIDKGYSKRATAEEYKAALIFINNRFFYISPEILKDGTCEMPTHDWINEKVRYLKLQNGVNAFIKDPWNKIMDLSGLRDDQSIALALSKDKTFANLYSAAFYVAHPTRPVKDKLGKIPMPDQFSIAGGAMFNNMMDNILCIWRPFRQIDKTSKDVKFVALKIRRKNIVGNEGEIDLTYDWVSQRYYSTVEEINPFEQVSTQKEDWEYENLPF